MAILSAGDRLEVEAIPVEIRLGRPDGARSTIQQVRESAERDQIRRALEESGGL